MEYEWEIESLVYVEYESYCMIEKVKVLFYMEYDWESQSLVFIDYDWESESLVVCGAW